jgi:hypothetical protein
MYQAGFVLALALASAARPRAAGAVQAATPSMCNGHNCTDDCGKVWTSINCSDCGGDAYPFCGPDIWNCGAGEPYGYGCAFAT